MSYIHYYGPQLFVMETETIQERIEKQYLEVVACNKPPRTTNNLLEKLMEPKTDMTIYIPNYKQPDLNNQKNGKVWWIMSTDGNGDGPMRQIGSVYDYGGKIIGIDGKFGFQFNNEYPTPHDLKSRIGGTFSSWKAAIVELFKIIHDVDSTISFKQRGK